MKVTGKTLSSTGKIGRLSGLRAAQVGPQGQAGPGDDVVWTSPREARFLTRVRDAGAQWTVRAEFALARFQDPITHSHTASL